MGRPATRTSGHGTSFGRARSKARRHTVGASGQDLFHSLDSSDTEPLDKTPFGDRGGVEQLSAEGGLMVQQHPAMLSMDSTDGISESAMRRRSLGLARSKSNKKQLADFKMSMDSSFDADSSFRRKSLGLVRAKNGMVRIGRAMSKTESKVNVIVLGSENSERAVPSKGAQNEVGFRSKSAKAALGRGETGSLSPERGGAKASAQTEFENMFSATDADEHDAARPSHRNAFMSGRRDGTEGSPRAAGRVNGGAEGGSSADPRSDSIAKKLHMNVRASLTHLFHDVDSFDLAREEGARRLFLRRSVQLSDATPILSQVQLSEDVSTWRSQLKRVEYACLQKRIMEPAYFWKVTDLPKARSKKGVFECAVCQYGLYDSETFELRSQWPTFKTPLERAVRTVFVTKGRMAMAELSCYKCESFLGFRLDPDQRGSNVDCVNSACILFNEDDGSDNKRRGVRALFQKKK